MVLAQCAGTGIKGIFSLHTFLDSNFESTAPTLDQSDGTRQVFLLFKQELYFTKLLRLIIIGFHLTMFFPQRWLLNITNWIYHELSYFSRSWGLFSMLPTENSLFKHVHLYLHFSKFLSKRYWKKIQKVAQIHKNQLSKMRSKLTLKNHTQSISH